MWAVAERLGTVVHISTADNSGGAARAAFRIHTGLLELGWTSRMLTGFKVERGREEIECLPRQDRLRQKVWKRVVNVIEQRTGLEYLLLPWKRQFLSHPFVVDADVVHLHNLHGGFFSHTILPALSREKAVVWSIHDLSPLTGHCYFPDMYGCVRWKTGCGRCPGLRQDGHYPLSVDTTAYLWRTKRQIYARSHLTVVAQSRWTLEQIRSSPLLGDRETHLIPYGVDVKVFRPIPRETAREALGLARDEKIVFFSAVGLSSERKGWRYLREALGKVAAGPSARRLTLLTAGDAPPKDAGDLGVRFVHLGTVSNDRFLALAYSAADLYAGASLVETFGQVFLEAMACGAPSVAFDTSGVADVVRHLDTGYLARHRDSEDLSRGIRLLLEREDLRAPMSVRCREVAEREYSVELQARRYAELYSRKVGETLAGRVGV